jgi:hypothetical protein
MRMQLHIQKQMLTKHMPISDMHLFVENSGCEFFAHKTQKIPTTLPHR